MPKTPSPNNYFYPGTSTLKNKYGIKDTVFFMEVYARDVAEGIAQLRTEPLPDNLDASYLSYIHKKLFFNTFEWAGHPRNIPFTFEDGTTAVMPEMVDPEWGTVFATGDQISKNLTKLSGELFKENNLQGLSREEFVEQATPLFAFLHATHPFRVGNSCTQELFFESIARAAGHSLDFSLAKQEDISFACIKAAEEGDLEPLKSLFEHISNPQHVSKELLSHTKTQQKDHVSPEQWKTLKSEGEAIFTTSKTGNFGNVLIPKKNLPPLAKTEINTMVGEDPNIRESRERIQSLSKLVYGKSKILDKQMMQISTNFTNPSSAAYKLSHQMKINPKSVGKLAGISFCGLKNARRRTAEKNVTELTNEIVNFSLTVRHVQKEITRDYQNEQERCATEVRMPSESLQAILAAPKELQRQAFKESPALAKELDTFVKVLHKRLSPDEQKAIKSEDYKELAKIMGLSEEKAQQITSVARKAKVAHLNSETQTRAIKHSKGLAIAS
ncbi:BID domain-containing T4SS effector [Bartonella taylorii]|uniref:BID domain-containing T4SS effector n=1 Tax=Bartonella taylorii TaxID=33046 RepID=UPI001ABA84A2|nr:BID domain-containing T4SS effector [Bartonella taylorii]